MANLTHTAQSLGTADTTASNREKIGFFEDDNGARSSMRLMSVIALVAAILFEFLTLWLAYHGKSDGGNGIILTFGFLMSAFAPKVVQKFAEQKISPTVTQK